MLVDFLHVFWVLSQVFGLQTGRSWIPQILEISRRRFGLEKPEVQLFYAFGLVVLNGVVRIDVLHLRTLRTGPTDTLARVLFRRSAR